MPILHDSEVLDYVSDDLGKYVFDSPEEALSEISSNRIESHLSDLGFVVLNNTANHFSDELSQSIQRMIELHGERGLIEILDRHTHEPYTRQLEKTDPKLNKKWLSEIAEFNQQCEQKRKAA